MRTAEQLQHVVGWEPEGQVYFNYSANTAGERLDEFTIAAAHADIDNNNVCADLGLHRKGATVDGKTHGRHHRAASAPLPVSATRPSSPC